MGCSFNPKCFCQKEASGKQHKENDGSAFRDGKSKERNNLLGTPDRNLWPSQQCRMTAALFLLSAGAFFQSLTVSTLPGAPSSGHRISPGCSDLEPGEILIHCSDCGLWFGFVSSTSQTFQNTFFFFFSNLETVGHLVYASITRLLWLRPKLLTSFLRFFFFFP